MISTVSGSPDLQGVSYGSLQLVVQHTVYALSRTIFEYGSAEFDLSSAIRSWASNKPNDKVLEVVQLQARPGASSALIGYLSSTKSCGLTSILATAGILRYIQPTLTGVASGLSPLNFGIAAVDYRNDHLVNDYQSIQSIVPSLGWALIGCKDISEAQDVVLLSALISNKTPSVFTYDGIRGISETSKLNNMVSSGELRTRYSTLLNEIKHASIAEIFKEYNEFTGLNYAPFEYEGDEKAETVIVSFGSVESTVAAQAARQLMKDGHRVGAVNVRLFSPFLEKDFLAVLPRATKKIIVLGGASSSQKKSPLGSAVFTSLVLHDLKIDLEDYKYESDALLSLELIFGLFGFKNVVNHSSGGYVFWDIDNGLFTKVSNPLAFSLSLKNTENVTYFSVYDNYTLGGAIRSDLRASAQPVSTPYSVSSADLVFVNDHKLVSHYDVLKDLSPTGQLVIAGDADTLLEKILPAWFINQLAVEYPNVSVYALNGVFLAENASHATDVRATHLAEQMVFWKLTEPELSIDQITSRIVQSNGTDTELVAATIASLAEAVFRRAFKKLEVKKVESDEEAPNRPASVVPTSFGPSDRSIYETPESYPEKARISDLTKSILFKEAYGASQDLRPDLAMKNAIAKVSVNQRVTPTDYDRHIFHMELDITGTGLKYAIGEALGIHAVNNKKQVAKFIQWYGLDANALVSFPNRDDSQKTETKTIYQALKDNVDLFGKPGKKFYENLSQYASNVEEKKHLLRISSPAGADELKERSESDMENFVDILQEFPSAHPPIEQLIQLIGPSKRREYSIASSQKVHPNSVHLLVVVVDWVDAKGRKRFGQSSKYLADLGVGAEVVVSVKPSVTKLPPLSTTPIIMAGLGTGLAPFKAFLEEKAWQKANGQKIGEVYLFLGSRHQRQEYLYGELFEAYKNAGILTYIGAAFSRDQPQKIYIQDRIVEAKDQLADVFVGKQGSFYLCGPTWPVPDISAALVEVIQSRSRETVDPAKEIEALKEAERYILEVY